jgi:pilus assembly protein CpaB
MIMLVLAVALGLGAMMITQRLMKKPAAPGEETQEIVVAARDFKIEEVLKPDMVKTVRWVKKAIPVGAFASYKDIEDRWVKTTMLEGDPIVEKKLGPKGTPPGLVANIPPGMRAFAVEVNEQSGVSGFILPGHRVDVIRWDANDRKQQVGETILQNILVLAAGQVFTRPEEKAVQSRTVTLAVKPDQVDILVGAKAKGPLALALRGVNDNEIVERPEPKPAVNEEEKAHRLKLEKELAELREALAKKMSEPPPPPPPPPAPKAAEPKLPAPRWTYVYRPLGARKDNAYPERIAINEHARKKLAEQQEQQREEAKPTLGFGNGPALTGVQAESPEEAVEFP